MNFIQNIAYFLVTIVITLSPVFKLNISITVHYMYTVPSTHRSSGYCLRIREFRL